MEKEGGGGGGGLTSKISSAEGSSSRRTMPKHDSWIIQKTIKMIISQGPQLVTKKKRKGN